MCIHVHLLTFIKSQIRANKLPESQLEPYPITDTNPLDSLEMRTNFSRVAWLIVALVQ